MKTAEIKTKIKEIIEKHCQLSSKTVINRATNEIFEQIYSDKFKPKFPTENEIINWYDKNDVEYAPNRLNAIIQYHDWLKSKLQ